MVTAFLVENFEKKHNYIIPDVYKEFLISGKKRSFDDGKLFYSLQDILEMNSAQNISKYLSGYIAIGDDGGGLIFLMKQEKKAEAVYIVDMGDCSLSSCYQIIDSFVEWSEQNFLINKDCRQQTKVSVLLIKPPHGGLMDLLRIKEVFEMNISASELIKLKNINNLPFILISDVYETKAKKMIECFGKNDIFDIKCSVSTD